MKNSIKRSSSRYNRSFRNRRKNLQVKITRSLLHVATLVAIAVLLFSITVSTFTMLGTCIKLGNISDGVRYYERERYLAIELGLGKHATECDDNILELYAQRNELINSENDIVSYTALHKWPAIGLILLYFALVAGIVYVIRKCPKKGFEVYMKVIDIEEFLLRCIVALVSFIMMWIFTFVSALTDSLANAFNEVWNQSKPRRKPASVKQMHKKPAQANNKVVPIERPGRRSAL